MKRNLIIISTIVLAMLASTLNTQAANILWVSDSPAAGFSGPGTGLTDQGFVTLLQNAGHNVMRFNPADSQNTLLTQAELDAINTNDLTILGRALNSGGFQAPQGAQWNTNVTKPLIVMSAYLVRASRLGWCTAETVPDGVPTPLTVVDPTDPESDYLFGGVAMTGNTMADLYDEADERNTSHTSDSPVAGGRILSTATFIPLAGSTPTTVNAIMEWPADTAVKAGAHLLGGYRMYFGGGIRESNGGTVVLNAGRENLTQAGEDIFLRAVQLALNNGVTPADPNAPLNIVRHPEGTNVLETVPVTFSFALTGAPPRTVQWQRDMGDGVTFTNIPGAVTTFQTSVYTISDTQPADSGFYRVVATGPFNTVTSDPAQLIVTGDSTPPTVVSVAAKHTMTNLIVVFSEPVDLVNGADVFSYNINGDAIGVLRARLIGDGSTVLLDTDILTPDTDYTVEVTGVNDRAAHPNPIGTPNSGTTRSWVWSPGFLVGELFTDIAGTAIGDLTIDPKYPDFSDMTFLVNESQTATGLGDNYGGHLVGYVIPPVDGNYTFYIRGDDGTELRLGAGADPASLTAVAAVTAANQPFTSGMSAPQTLFAGQPYLIEALWKEGTGGDYVQVAWSTPWDTNIDIIPCANLATYANPIGASVSVTAHPESRTTIENQTATFSVAAEAMPSGKPVCYQWQRADGLGGFTNILGANGPIYITPSLVYPDDDGSVFRAMVRAPGGVTDLSDPATLTVVEDTQPPVLVSAVRANPYTKVSLVFDEAVSPGTAIDGYNYHLINLITGFEIELDTLNVTLGPDGNVVFLTALEPLTNGGFYTISASGISDLAGNVAGEQTVNIELTGAFVPSGPLNLVVVEAEHADNISPRTINGVVYNWEVATDRAGYSGDSALQSLPDATDVGPADATGPSIDINVIFPEGVLYPQTYYLWVRGAGFNGNSDSCHGGIDGVVPATADQMSGFNVASGFVWKGTSQETGNPRITLDVPSPGLHILSVYMRENGFYCDKFLVTTDVAYDPSTVNGGLGPDESIRQNPFRAPELTISESAGEITIRWTGPGRLQSADAVTGTWSDVNGAVSPYTAPASGQQKFYQVVFP